MANYAGADIQGQIISTVYSGDVNNPWGGLTFTYQVFADSSSTEGVRRFTAGNFGGFQTDVSYDDVGGGYDVLPAALPVSSVAPQSVDRSGSGNVIGFDFPLLYSPIQPGMNSALLVIQTDAMAWQPGLASVIDASAETVLSLAPIVPEPTTAGLMGLGAIALMAARRRR
jgi:hypothetical protein